jgi:hypothetical protein
MVVSIEQKVLLEKMPGIDRGEASFIELVSWLKEHIRVVKGAE